MLIGSNSSRRKLIIIVTSKYKKMSEYESYYSHRVFVMGTIIISFYASED